MENSNDDLQLRVLPKSAQSTHSGSMGISEELVDHLNEQICSLKNECARLYNLLREKDLELKRLKKFNEEAETVGVAGVTNEVVAVKVVELSKRVRELTAEVESERNKSKRAMTKIRELEANRGNKSAEVAPATVTAPADEDKLASDLKAANDRARFAEGRIADLRNQLEESRREARVAMRVLNQEIGDGVDVHSLLRNEGQGNWKGRAQQIQILQKKVSELKASLGSDVASNRQASDPSDFGSVLSGAGDLSSTRQSTATSRHFDALKRFEKDRRAEQDRLISEKAALQRELDDAKQVAKAAKARNKTLQEDVKSLRERVEQLLDKSRHDDEFVQMLMKQQESLRQTMTAPSRQSNSASSESGKNRIKSGSQQERDNQRIAEMQATIVQLQRELEQSNASRARSASSDPGGALSAPEIEVVELRGLLEAAKLECGRLREIIGGVHDDMDKMAEEKLSMGSELAGYRREQVLMEKQIGRLKLDLEKATGRGGEASQRHRQEISLSEAEDLRVKVDVLTEERTAYRLALEKSSQQRKQELSLFEQLLNETKSLFSQSVRQLARRTQSRSSPAIQ